LGRKIYLRCGALAIVLARRLETERRFIHKQIFVFN
jgi:hypothetical protein